MSNALHDYAKLFEKYAANNGGTGAILAGEDCLALANEMRMDADDLERENAKLRELATMLHRCARGMLRDLAPSCVDRSKEGCGMDCTDNGERCCMELLERRMRELGVKL